MKAGFDRGVAITQEFAQSVSSTIANIGSGVGPSFGAIGANAATDLISNLTKEFDSRQAELKEAFARGALSKEAFTELGEEAAHSFNTVLLNSLDNADFSKAISPQAREDLVNALKDAGIKGADEFTNSFTSIGEKLRSLGRDTTQIGRELSIGLTVPIAAAATAAIASADAFDHAVDSIRVSTGKVGPSLDALAESMHTLFDQLPNTAGDIATALAVISRSSGAAGNDLEALATQVLQLSTLTGTDLKTNVEQSQQAFKAWGTAIRDQKDNLDLLFGVSQQTGTTVDQLDQAMAHFAPTLQQLGLSFGQSAALIGEFQKNGIDADSTLTALQTSLSKFAQRGVDGATALALLVNQVKAAATDADAINLASRIFGPREAAQMSNAIRSGVLDINGLADAVRASGASIGDTAKGTNAFGNAVNELAHHWQDAVAVIGDQLEKIFIALQPVLVGIADATKELALTFADLPEPVKVVIGTLVGLAAAIGPLALVLGGITKGIGATSLAIGIFQNALKVLTLGKLAEDATGVEGAMSDSAAAAVKLAGALRGLVVGAVITGIFALIGSAMEHATEDSRNLQTALAKLKDSLGGLDNTQLQIQTDVAQANLSKLQKAAEDLAAKIKEATTPSGEVGGLNLSAGGTFSDQSSVPLYQQQLVGVNKSILIASAALDTMHAKMKQNADDAKDAAEKLANFNASVKTLIESSGLGLKVNSAGDVTGSLQSMEKELAKLQAQLKSPIAIPGLDTKAASGAIDALSTAISNVKAKAGPDLRSIFDQLSFSVIELDRQISNMKGHLDNLGGEFQQLQSVSIGANLITDLDKVNAALSKIRDYSSQDAQNLLAQKAALESLASVQIGSNQSGSLAFVVDIKGRIKEIEVTQGASDKLAQLVADSTQKIHDAAQAASVSGINTQVATASGDAAKIAQATDTQARAYDRLNTILEAYKQNIKDIHASTDQQNAAIKAGTDIANQGGANSSLIVPFKAPDIGAIFQAAALRATQTGQLNVPIIPVVRQEALAAAGVQVAQELAQASLQGLAGNFGAAQGLATKALDGYANKIKSEASAALALPANQQAAAYAKLVEQMKAAGFSAQQINAALDDQRVVTQIGKISAAFATAASAAFGANSAIAGFAGGIDQAVQASKKLDDAFSSLKAAGGKGGGIADLIAGVGSLATGVAGAIGAAASVASALFGESALQKEHDAILKSNNDALKNLENSLDREAGSAARAGQLAQAVAQTQTEAFQKLLAGFGPSGGFTLGGNAQDEQNAFSKILATFHLTLDQAVASAKSFGIQIEDSAGHLINLDQFMKALSLDASLLTSLGKDFSTQQQLIQVQNSLSGGTVSPQKKVNDALDALIKTITAVNPSSSIADSLTTAAAQGSVQLRAALTALVAQIESPGGVKLSDLGGFKDVSELLNAILSTSDAMNGLAGAAGSVSGALQNVPAGFKKALAEFNAGSAQQPPGSPVGTPPPPNIDPTPITNGISALIAQLKSSIGGGGLGASSDVSGSLSAANTAVSKSADGAGKSLSDVASTLHALLGAGDTTTTSLGGLLASLTGLPKPATDSGKSISDVLSTLAQVPPVAQSASDAISALLSGLSVTHVNVKAPVFHVEQFAPVTLPPPSVNVASLAPVHLAPPVVSFAGGLKAVTLDPPVVSVLPFAPITLAAPQVTVMGAPPVSIAAPGISVEPTMPIVIPAPTITLNASKATTLRADPPLVTLTRGLATVVVQPPAAVVSPYTSTVSLSPPVVSVSRFTTVQLSAPPVHIATPEPLSLAAPMVHVSPLGAVVLAQPQVTVKPLASIELAAPRVTVKPVTSPVEAVLKFSGTLDVPTDKLPNGTNSVPGVDTGKLAAQLAALVAAQTDAANTPPSSDVNLNGATFNIDARSKSASEIFDDVKTEVQKRARQQTGNSTNVLTAFQR